MTHLKMTNQICFSDLYVDLYMSFCSQSLQTKGRCFLFIRDYNPYLQTYG